MRVAVVLVVLLLVPTGTVKAGDATDDKTSSAIMRLLSGKKDIKVLMSDYYKETRPAFISKMSTEIRQSIGDIGVTDRNIATWFDEASTQATQIMSNELMVSNGNALVEASDWEKIRPVIGNATSELIRQRLRNYITTADTSRLTPNQQALIQAARFRENLNTLGQVLGNGFVPQ